MNAKFSEKELNQLLDWFGLNDKEINITLEDDVKGVMDKYYDENTKELKIVSEVFEANGIPFRKLSACLSSW